nr:hypothetical protein [Tanacetum cinerariifolium]
MYKMVTFMVNLYHNGSFASNPLRLVLDKPLSFFYILPGVRMNIDMYTEHQGYDVLEMINDDRHCEDKSDSDFEDVEKGDNLDDVKDIVNFQTKGEENVDISKLSIDDPWLNKLVGKGRFVGEMEDPIPGLKGMKFESPSQLKQCLANYGVTHGYQLWYMQNDTYKLLVKCGRDVSAGSSHKDLGKGSAGWSFDKGKGILGEDRSEPSKVSQATKERWRKKKLEEKVNLKNAVDCPFRLWASWMRIEKSFQIKTLYPDHKCCRNYNLRSLVTYRWIAEHYTREIIDNLWVFYNYMQNFIRSKFMINVSLGLCKRAKQAALFDHEGGLIDHYSKIWQYRQVVLDSNPGSTCHINLEEKDDGLTYFKRFYGQLMTAMGRDANNQIFPIVWAVVGVENKNNWCWFLSLLSDDINLNGVAGLIVISNGNKGLLEAMKIWLPDAEHRQCTRHIYANFKKKRNGLQFKRLFWKATASSMNEQFLEVMEEIKAINENAYTWLVDQDLNTWSRAYFEVDRSCAAFENGISESFNSTTMELNDSITPFAIRHLEFMKIKQRSTKTLPGEMKLPGRQDEAFGVNIHLKKCACKMWELTGLPCVHVVAGSTKTLPGEMKLPGRPRKRRIRHPSEYDHEISRVGRVMHCHRCWQSGQNKSKCTNAPKPKPGNFYEIPTDEERQHGSNDVIERDQYQQAGPSVDEIPKYREDPVMPESSSVNPSEQTHVIASASSGPVDEQPKTSQDPSTEKAGSSAPVDQFPKPQDPKKKANKRKRKQIQNNHYLLGSSIKIEGDQKGLQSSRSKSSNLMQMAQDLLLRKLVMSVIDCFRMNVSLG